MQREDQTLANLQADLKKMRVLRKIVAPVDVHLELTAKLCEELVKKGAYKEAARALRPWSVAGDVAFLGDCALLQRLGSQVRYSKSRRRCLQ